VGFIIITDYQLLISVLAICRKTFASRHQTIKQNTKFNSTKCMWDDCFCKSV